MSDPASSGVPYPGKHWIRRRSRRGSTGVMDGWMVCNDDDGSRIFVGGSLWNFLSDKEKEGADSFSSDFTFGNGGGTFLCVKNGRDI